MISETFCIICYKHVMISQKMVTHIIKTINSVNYNTKQSSLNNKLISNYKGSSD